MNYRYNGYKGYKGYNGYNRYKGYNGYNVLYPPVWSSTEEMRPIFLDPLTYIYLAAVLSPDLVQSLLDLNWVYGWSMLFKIFSYSNLNESPRKALKTSAFYKNF